MSAATKTEKERSLRDRILDEHEAWRRHVEDMATARRALEGVQQQSLEESQRRAALEREHAEKVRAAAYTGTEVPPDLPPASVGLANALRIAAERTMAVSGDQPRVLAGLADRIEEQAAARYAEVIDDVRFAVAAIDRSKAEVNELLAVVVEVRSAVESFGPRRTPSRSSQTRNRISAAELVEAVSAGHNVLDPMPTLGLQGDIRRVQVDHGYEGEGFRVPPHQPPPTRGLNV